MFPIKPLNDRLIVQRLKNKQKVGDLFIPDNAKEKPQLGQVLATGVDVKHIHLDSLVMFGKYSGSEIKIDNTEYLIMKEDEVIGIIVDKKLAEQYETEGA
jgi:chaperonin GroES